MPVPAWLWHLPLLWVPGRRFHPPGLAQWPLSKALVTFRAEREGLIRESAGKGARVPCRRFPSHFQGFPW